MSKFKLFMENFLVYGLGGVINKIIPLIMVPIITKLMPNTTYFGINDLVNTVCSFAGAIAILGMYDGMYRMFFDKDDEGYKRTVCSTTLAFTMISTLVVCLILFLAKNLITVKIFKNEKYEFLIYLCIISTIVNTTNCIVSAPTRMQNKRKIFLITNFMTSILSYAISIPLLLNGHFIIALPLATIISGASIELIFWVMNKSWFSICRFDKNVLINTLKIALPLFPNFIVYWVFNSADRVMIANMLDVSDVGIYSVGAKLGHISQLIYTAFSGGWLFYSFSTMKDKDQIKSNSHIFEYMGIVSFICVAFMCAASYPVFKILFEKDYVLGYKIAPYLFFAPLLQMLFQIICNQFVIIKKTWPNVLLLSIGAIANVLINLWLIPILGIEGASIATLAGYTITLIVTTIVLLKMKLMVISIRFICSCILIVTFLISWRLLYREKIIIGFIMALLLSTVLISFYYKDIIKIFSGGKMKKTE